MRDRAGSVFAPDDLQMFKFGVHMVLVSVGVAALLYNAGSWLARKQPHLAVNVIVYSVLASFEVGQLRRHLMKGVSQE